MTKHTLEFNQDAIDTLTKVLRNYVLKGDVLNEEQVEAQLLLDQIEHETHPKTVIERWVDRCKRDFEVNYGDKSVEHLVDDGCAVFLDLGVDSEYVADVIRKKLAVA